MAGKNQKLALTAAAVIMVVAGLGPVVYFGGESARQAAVKPSAPAAAPVKLKDFAGEPVQVQYERTVGLNQPIEVSFRFRDYSNLPADFGSAADLDRLLRPLSGQARFTVKEFGTLDQIDQFNKAGDGDTYYYALFDFAGNTGNPAGPKIHPNSIQESGWDPAPQLVIIADGKMAYQDVPATLKLDRARGLVEARYVDLSQPKVNPLGAIWPNAKGYAPDLALRYIDQAGAVKFIRIEAK